MNAKSATLSPRPGIMDISPYVGGRSSLGDRRNVIKLSSNESALGPSKRAIEAFTACGESLHRYPDGGASALRTAIGTLHGIDPERIVCGAGSDELLGLLAKAYAGPGDEVLYSRHGFLVYEIAARAVGATPVAAPETDHRADVDALLGQVTAKTRIVFLANPNNPTGTYLSKGELRRLWGGLPENALLVIDSAYAEFVSAPDYEAGLDLVDVGANVVMTRTFSKIYGLASLRLGWAYGPPAVIDVLNRIRGPFNVGGPALAAGLAAVEDQAHVERARAHNDKWLARLSERLPATGLEVVPSVCNFVLIRFPQQAGRDSKAADAYLSERGLILRNVDNYHLPDCLRASIGLDDEMEALLRALEEFMS